MPQQPAKGQFRLAICKDFGIVAPHDNEYQYQR